MHDVEAIYIFSQYSSHSNAVSSVERTTLAHSSFFQPSLYPFLLSRSPVPHEYWFYEYVLLELAYLLPDSTIAQLIERRKLKRFNLKSLCRFVSFD